ncbi:NACHT domain-containing NTPase [Mycobacterium sp. 852002-51971_SCH5477799-a]|uniref:NACHT domain-containing protein n=1 Tax=Mycobacterium sp. 852002-51971_SCH5477799-a TaxID=1834106 RepID=UPI0012E72F88|nr:hypothetical protein [Mycobacterium sp. 852002-51971_SCH5477799-a]
MQFTNSMIGGDVNVTFGDPSVYEAMGPSEYLARALAASDSRIERRRAGAGLDEAQIDRIRYLLPPVPVELTTLTTGRLIVLTGPLGAGKSDIAEAWVRAAITTAQTNSEAPVPVWVSIDELESSLELDVRREVGLHALENLGADIVVDGLDQRADRAETVIRQAVSLIDRWPRSRVVLTSRATQAVSASTRVEVQPLSKAQGQQLASLVAGVARIGNISPQIEEALKRPLFALLVGQQSTLEQLTTMTEVIEGVVRKIVASENQDLYQHLRRLAVETVTTGRAVDPELFADFDIAAQIRRSPFVTTTAHGVSFSLATIEQWFASRALLEDAVDIGDTLRDLVSFDRWKYVLSMVLASGEPSRVDSIMATIARWNPGAISWIINETETAGLSRNREDIPAEHWQEIGTRLRLALASLLDGLGPLSAAFTPFRITTLNDLEDFSLALNIRGGRVDTTWLISSEIPDETLPAVINTIPRQTPFNRRFMCMEWAAVPTGRNWVWPAARRILAKDLAECFTTIAIGIAAKHDGIVRSELKDQIRRSNLPYPTTIDEVADGLYGSVYPLPDIAPGRSGWPGFSIEAMSKRFNAIIRAAISCYEELCATVAPKFGDTLAHSGLMPFEYYGNINFSASSDGEPLSLGSIGPPEAGLRWLLRPTGVPLPNGKRNGKNSVNVTVNDESRDKEIMDNYSVFSDAHFLYFANTPGLEPFADSFSVSTGRFNLADKKPATHLALGWLWQDLVKLKWAKGLMPPDKTE